MVALLYIQIECPLCEMHENKNDLHFRIIFSIVEYSHIHNKLFGDVISINTKVIYVSCTPYTYNLKVILYYILDIPARIQILRLGLLFA